jgi:hypothetical protein
MLRHVSLVPEDKQLVEVLGNRFILVLSHGLEFIVHGISAEVHAHVVLNVIKEVH